MAFHHCFTAQFTFDCFFSPKLSGSLLFSGIQINETSSSPQCSTSHVSKLLLPTSLPVLLLSQPSWNQRSAFLLQRWIHPSSLLEMEPASPRWRTNLSSRSTRRTPTTMKKLDPNRMLPRKHRLTCPSRRKRKRKTASPKANEARCVVICILITQETEAYPLTRSDIGQAYWIRGILRRCPHDAG